MQWQIIDAPGAIAPGGHVAMSRDQPITPAASCPHSWGCTRDDRLNVQDTWLLCMNDFESLSVYVSAVSALIALWAIVISRRTASDQKQIAQRTQQLEERSLAATHHAKYSELLFSVQVGISESADRLSQEARQALESMIHLVDALSSKAGVRPARHIFDEICESLYKAFAPELLWQSGLNLATRFSALKWLDEDLEALYEHRNEIEKRATKAAQDLKEIQRRNPNARAERLVVESAGFQLRLLELCDRIAPSDRNKLLQAAIPSILKFSAVHHEEQPKLVEALQRLQRGLDQNRLEEFPLKESPALHMEYRREMARIESMECFSLADAEYLEGINVGFIMGQLLYFGSLLYTMQMCTQWPGRR